MYPGTTVVNPREAEGASQPNCHYSTMVPAGWFRNSGLVQNSWALVGPIELMGRLLAGVKSVSVARKKKGKPDLD